MSTAARSPATKVLASWRSRPLLHLVEVGAGDGFGLPGAAPLADLMQDSFTRQLGALPDQTRRLVQLAAADPYGDRQRLWRAAGRLGIPAKAAVPAVEAGLVEFGTRVRFRHLLARSAAYWSASYAERRAVHAALAEVTDPEAEPDRRAWHRAQAVSGPDEEVAAELEQSAGRAQARGGLAAAAAFGERSVLLTADPARHAERVLTAAQVNMQAGALGKARELLAEAEALGSGQLGELGSARAALLRGQITFASGLGSEAPALLLQAAKRLESLDAGLTREAYLSAWMAALSAGRLASEDITALPISMWALPELVEAAARAGQAGLARDALKQLAEITQACGHDPALGIEARCRALLSHDADADEKYREAIDRLGRTGLRPELARAHLLYGEWLRRGGRRVQAREPLRTARDMLAALGMAAFAERARRELIVTGETARKRSVETLTTLTAQEALIAQLARDGRTNPEIGAQLFLSGRTVEWHLRKIFTKLGISSRRELHDALAQAA